MDMDKSKMRRAVRSRRGRAGETLAETLVAMLIIGLSSVLFVTMVGAAGRIFQTAKTGYKTICDNVTAAEKQEGDGVTSIGKITVAGTEEGSSSSVEVDVKWYGEEDSVLSYK